MSRTWGLPRTRCGRSAGVTRLHWDQLGRRLVVSRRKGCHRRWGCRPGWDRRAGSIWKTERRRLLPRRTCSSGACRWRPARRGPCTQRACSSRAHVGTPGRGWASSRQPDSPGAASVAHVGVGLAGVGRRAVTPAGSFPGGLIPRLWASPQSTQKHGC